MWLQFFAQNAHFAINLFAALVCMGVCWLYLDAWSNKHSLKELLKWLGFGFISLSFLAQSTVVEQSVLGKSTLGHVSVGVAVVTRLLGYTLLIIGLLVDPLNPIPKNEGLKLQPDEPVPPKAAAGLGSAVTVVSRWLLPVGGLTIALLYWRRATKGLERHLKPVAGAFALFALSDFIALASLARDTSNPTIYGWVAAFGWIWWLQQLALLAGVIILGFWTWGYLTKRFFSQLFMIFTGMVVSIFLFVSVCFTGLLLRNVRTDEVANLTTSVNVLDYALKAKQSETSSAAQQLAGSSDVVSAIANHDRPALISLTNTYLKDKKLSGLIITSQSGQVLLRGQDNEQWGDSLSSDPLVVRALVGLNQSTVTSFEGVGAPSLQVRSAVAAKDAHGTVVGSIISTLDLDSAFVDGIKQATGLQSSVYAGNVLSATTQVAADGKTRPVGVKLVDARVKKAVIENGQAYSGELTLQHRRTLGAFLPVKDTDNTPVGMILISEPESAILLAAGRSVELTFIIAVLLLLVSIVPSYYITKSLTKQLD